MTMITVDIDLGDVLDELSDEELLEELRRRRKEVPPTELASLEASLEWLRSLPDVPKSMRDLVYDVLGRII